MWEMIDPGADFPMNFEHDFCELHGSNFDGGFDFWMEYMVFHPGIKTPIKITREPAEIMFKI